MSIGSEEVTYNKQTSTVGDLSSGRVKAESYTDYNYSKYRMQESSPQMASIPEDTHSTSSNGSVVAVTSSSPIVIPGTVTQSCSIFGSSPAYSPSGSFMIRRYSSPSLSSMCFKCGSSPISCQTASTQTPQEYAQHPGSPLDGDDSEEREGGEDSDSNIDMRDMEEQDSDDDVLVDVPAAAAGERWRSLSESGSGSRYPLPDLLEFRNRSHSEPAESLRPEIEVGRELRRISDEFHLSYQECRVIHHAAGEQNMRQNFFWQLVGTIRRRASFRRGSSV